MKIPDFDLAETKLNEASEKDIQAAREGQAFVNRRLLSAAASKAANGDMKLTQLAYAEAIDYYRQAVQLVPAGEESIQADYLSREGKAALEFDLPNQAAPPLERALQITMALFGVDDLRTAIALTYTASVYTMLGRPADAERLLRYAAKLFELGGAAQRANLARTLNTLAGAVNNQQGRRAEAEQLYRCALAVSVRALGRHHPDVAVWLYNLANIYVQTARYAAAMRLQRYALRIDEQTLGPERPATVRRLVALSQILMDTGRGEEGEQLLKRAITAGKRVLGNEHLTVINRILLLSVYLIENKKYGEAEFDLRNALIVCQKKFGENFKSTLLCLNNLGRLCSETGRYEEAEMLLDRAITSGSYVFSDADPDFAVVLHNKAQLLRIIGRGHDAEILLKNAIEILKKGGNEYKPVGLRNKKIVSRIYANLAEVYSNQGRNDEVTTYYRRALETLEPQLNLLLGEYLSLAEKYLKFLQGIQRLDEACIIEKHIAQLQHKDSTVQGTT